MAIIRCQSCGKPNPDFLEVCQYCDARLKPLTGMLSPESAAPPAEQPGTIRCPACGKPNPNFLEVCQFCDARLVPLGAAPSLEAAPPSAEKPGIVMPVFAGLALVELEGPKFPAANTGVMPAATRTCKSGSKLRSQPGLSKVHELFTTSGASFVCRLPSGFSNH